MDDPERVRRELSRLTRRLRDLKARRRKAQKAAPIRPIPGRGTRNRSQPPAP